MNFRVVPLELELNRQFILAAGRARIKKNYIVITDGLGLGEAAGSIYYGITPEDLGPELARLCSITAETPEQGLDAWLQEQEKQYSHPAICAVSTALHDLRARQAGKPLYAQLGLVPPTPRQTSVTVSVGDFQDLERYAGGGWDAVKIKMDADPVTSGQVIEGMHRCGGVRFRIDANGSWIFEDAVRLLAETPLERVELIEQPFPIAAVDDWQRLREAITVPLIADEAVETADDVVRIGTFVDGVNIKIQKSGRLETAIGAMREARRLGLKVMLGCMIESSVGIATAWQLSSLADFIDLDGRWLVAADPFEGLTYDKGRLEISGGEGHGISANWDL
jgi:L-alanine-DL-glutamate epimerase-like enolase superfamily enzyme